MVMMGEIIAGEQAGHEPHKAGDEHVHGAEAVQMQVQAHAAELLGISRSLMQYKLKKYNI